MLYTITYSQLYVVFVLDMKKESTGSWLGCLFVECGILIAVVGRGIQNVAFVAPNEMYEVRVSESRKRIEPTKIPIISRSPTQKTVRKRIHAP